MSSVPDPAHERVYPLPYDPADDRLDNQLVELVADLIVFRTGYPFIGGPDLARLREVLHGFLYAAQAEAQTGHEIPMPGGGPCICRGAGAPHERGANCPPDGGAR